jgi:hypothetical protein
MNKFAFFALLSAVLVTVVTLAPTADATIPAAVNPVADIAVPVSYENKVDRSYSGGAPLPNKILSDPVDCESIALSLEEVISRATLYAEATGWEDPLVIDVELDYTGPLSIRRHMAVDSDADCAWYVAVKGTKYEDGWPPMPATPTPGPKNTYTFLEVLIDAETGARMAETRSSAIYPTVVPTAGPSSTPYPFPTTGPVFPTPTEALD